MNERRSLSDPPIFESEDDAPILTAQTDQERAQVIATLVDALGKLRGEVYAMFGTNAFGGYGSDAPVVAGRDAVTAIARRIESLSNEWDGSANG